MKKHIVLLALLTLAGCSREPRTELIRKMEQAGAGDVRTVTSQSIEQWFPRNPDVAFEMGRTCLKLKVNAPAKWGDMTDGRICAAASKVRVFYYRLRPVDGLAF